MVDPIKTQESFEAKHPKALKKSKSDLKLILLNLRLKMNEGHVFSLDESQNVDFMCDEPIGRHSVEFKGPLREFLLQKRLDRLGGYIDLATNTVISWGGFSEYVKKNDCCEVLKGKECQEKIRGVEKETSNWVELYTMSKEAQEKSLGLEDKAAGILLKRLMKVGEYVEKLRAAR